MSILTKIPHYKLRQDEPYTIEEVKRDWAYGEVRKKESVRPIVSKVQAAMEATGSAAGRIPTLQV